MSFFGTPKRPIGTDPKSYFLGWVWDYITSHGRLIDGPGYKISRMPQGQSIILAPAVLAPGAPQISVKPYNIQSVHGDYLIAIDGTQIAKGYKLRNSIGGETIYGTVVHFSYPHNSAGDSLFGVYRVASINNAGTENEGVTPQYLVNDIIYAVQLNVSVKDDAGNALALQWLDLNVDGRAWTRFSNPAF